MQLLPHPGSGCELTPPTGCLIVPKLMKTSSNNPDPPHRPVDSTKWRPLWYVLAPLVALVAYRTSLSFTLLGDARFLIETNPTMTDLGSMWTQLTTDYFSTPEGAHIGYWRPLTKGSWLIETVVGGGAYWVYHLVGVLWFAAGALGVTLLARALGLNHALAACAGVLFAIHAAAVEPVCLVMARSDVVSTTAIIWALFAWRQARRANGGGRFWWWGLHLLALVAGFASKEATVIVVPLLVLWSLFDGDLRSTYRRRLLSLVPAIGMCVGYLILRQAVLGESPTSDVDIDITRIAAGMGSYLTGLVPFRLETGVRNLARAEIGSASRQLVGWISLGVVTGTSLWLLLKGRLDGVLLLAWGVAALLLVQLMGRMRVPGGFEVVALADRWMLQSAAAFSLFIPWCIAQVGQRRVTRGFVVVTLLWAGIAVVLAAGLHAPYADQVTYLAIEDRNFEQLPDEYRTERDYCRYWSRRVIQGSHQEDLESVAWAYGEMSPACQRNREVRRNLLEAFGSMDQFQLAEPLLRPVLERIDIANDSPRLRYLMGAALVRGPDPALALPWLRAAVGAEPSCAVHVDLARAHFALDDHLASATALEDALVCDASSGGTRLQALRLQAIHEFINAGALDRARQLMTEVSVDQLSDLEQTTYSRLVGLLSTKP